jgi:hypothetical protein
MRIRFEVLLVLVALAASPAFAQGVTTAGDVTFRRTATPFDATPTADLVGVGAAPADDFLFETGWWFRVAGDTQEHPLPPPDAQNYVGNESLIQWHDVAGRGLFSATEITILLDLAPEVGGPAGFAQMSLTVENLSAVAPLSLEIFHVADFDVRTGFGDDSARLAQWSPNGLIELSDPGSQRAAYSASPDWTGYLVAPFGAGDVPAVLSDAALTEFENTGLPFGPADFTGGWQFSLLLPPNGSETVTALLLVNASFYCNFSTGLFCDGFESAGTSIWNAVTP